MRAAATIAIMVLLLAGCANDPDPATTGDPGDADDPASGLDPTILEAPTWNVGDWWRFGLGGIDAPITWVVTEAGPDGYWLDVDHPEFAFADAVSAPISTIGRIGPQLEGSQGDTDVRFFDFPLVAGKSWELIWDGIPFVAEVAVVDEGVAVIDAAAPSGEIRTYTYDRERRWFGSMDAYDANGTLQFTSAAAGAGSAYDGAYYRWDLGDHHIWESGFGDFVVSTVDVRAAEEIWYRLALVCDPDGLEGDGGIGTLEFHHEGDAAAGLSYRELCPTAVDSSSVLPGIDGQWGLSMNPIGASMRFEIVPRTLVEHRL